MAEGELIDSVERAFQMMVINALGSDDNVYTGKASSNKKIPCIICAADGDVEEDPPRTGNYWVNVEVSVKSTSATEPDATDDPHDEDVALLKSVFDIFRVNDLDLQINALGLDLTVIPQGFFFGTVKSGRDEQGVYVDTMPIRLHCCPSILAP